MNMMKYLCPFVVGELNWFHMRICVSTVPWTPHDFRFQFYPFYPYKHYYSITNHNDWRSANLLSSNKNCFPNRYRMRHIFVILLPLVVVHFAKGASIPVSCSQRIHIRPFFIWYEYSREFNRLFGDYFFQNRHTCTGTHVWVEESDIVYENVDSCQSSMNVIGNSA